MDDGSKIDKRFHACKACYENIDIESLSLEEIQELIDMLQDRQIKLDIHNAELEEIQKKLNSSVEKINRVYNNAPVIYFTFNKEGIVREANIYACSILGVSFAVLLERSFFDFIPENYKKTFQLHLKRVFSSVYPIKSEIKVNTSDGREIHLLCESVLADDDEFDEKVSWTTMMNISDLNNARVELDKQKEKLAITIESIGEAVISTDVNGRIDLINSVAENILGISRKDARERKIGSVLNIISSRNRASLIPTIEKCLITGNSIEFNRDAVLVLKDFNERNISFTSSAIKDRTNGIFGMVIVFKDISESIRMEKELHRAQKMESVGLLAGGLAHDFNNILMAILGNISLVKMKLENDEKNFHLIEQAEKAIFRARDLTQQLLSFSKGRLPLMVENDLVAIIDEAVEFIFSDTNISITKDYRDDLPYAIIDSQQISQTFQNILINSKQALTDDGKIEIKIVEEYIANDGNFTLVPGNYLKITIQDDGPGIPQSYLNKIFDPYFSLREKGSGLGLAVAFNIIHKHNGLIEVESEKGKGTRFEIMLPSNKPDTPKEKKQTIKGNRVLLMEDDEMVSGSAKIMLQHIGYTVVIVADGFAMLEEYRRAHKAGVPYDLVILDLTIIGGMGGLEANQLLKQEFPNSKALVVSGYINNPVLAHFESHGFIGILEKPYSIDNLSFVLNNLKS